MKCRAKTYNPICIVNLKSLEYMSKRKRHVTHFEKVDSSIPDEELHKYVKEHKLEEILIKQLGKDWDMPVGL